MGMSVSVKHRHVLIIGLETATVIFAMPMFLFSGKPYSRYLTVMDQSTILVSANSLENDRKKPFTPSKLT